MNEAKKEISVEMLQQIIFDCTIELTYDTLPKEKVILKLQELVNAKITS